MKTYNLLIPPQPCICTCMIFNNSYIVPQNNTQDTEMVFKQQLEEQQQETKGLRD